MSIQNMKTLAVGVTVLAAMSLTGCADKPVSIDPVPAYAPSPEAILRLKRVAMIELDNRGAPADVAKSFSEAVHLAFGAQRAFTVEYVPARQLADFGPCHGPRMSLEQLSSLRSALKCDAVIVGAITGFEPFPDSRCAVQIWLVDLRSGRVLWGVDHAWRVSDPQTARKMEWYFDSPDCQNPDDARRLAEMSPRAFSDFVAWDLARSLPLPPGLGETRPRLSKKDRLCEAAKNICTN